MPVFISAYICKIITLGKANCFVHSDVELEQIIYNNVWFSRLVLKIKRHVVLNALENLSLVPRQSGIFKISVEKQKARLENQKVYGVKCKKTRVFSFQDNLCSLSCIENQFVVFGIMHFWYLLRGAQFFFTD